jgi:hypothetical protein
MKNLLVSSILFTSITLFLDCSHQPGVSTVSKVIARIEISSPKFARTAETKNKWTDKITAKMSLYIDDGASGTGHHMAKSLHGGEDSFRSAEVDTVINDIGIHMRIDDGMNIHHHMNGDWSNMMPRTDQNLVMISLTDARNPDAISEGINMPIMYSTVSVNVRNDQHNLNSDTLFPIHDITGMYYGGNIILPEVGACTIGVMATAPLMNARDDYNRNRFLNDLEEDFILWEPTKADTLTYVGETVLEDDIGIRVLLDKPRTPWVPGETGYVQMTPDGATHFIMVKLTDLMITMNQHIMGYMDIHCTIYPETGTHASDSMMLIPVHGREGFYYGGNMHMPEHMGGGHHHDDDYHHY